MISSTGEVHRDFHYKTFQSKMSVEECIHPTEEAKQGDQLVDGFKQDETRDKKRKKRKLMREEALSMAVGRTHTTLVDGWVFRWMAGMGRHTTPSSTLSLSLLRE